MSFTELKDFAEHYKYKKLSGLISDLLINDRLTLDQLHEKLQKIQQEHAESYDGVKDKNRSRWKQPSIVKADIKWLIEHIPCVMLKEYEDGTIQLVEKVDYPLNNGIDTRRGGHLPNREDFESAYKRLTCAGGEISIDKILDQIEVKAKEAGCPLKNDWRIITEKNILDVWPKTKKELTNNPQNFQ